MSGDDHDHESHDETESWLISYADMMTLLFGFFVILYSFSQVDEAKFSALRKEMSEAFGGEFVEKFGSEVGHLTEARQLRAFQMLVSMMNLGDDMETAVRRIEAAGERGTTADKSLEQLKRDLRKSLKGEKQVTIDRGPGEEKLIDLTLSETLLFRPGGYELLPQGRAQVTGVAHEIARLGGYASVQVTGHSDSSPAPRGSGLDNWALSAMRAAAVARTLIDAGVPRDLIRVAGAGDLEPLFPEHRPDGSAPKDNMARNRRVQIRIKRAPEHDEL